MSVVTFEQEKFAVLTELTDEEINGIVGGKVAAADANVNVKVKGSDVIVITQVAVAVAPFGNAYVSQSAKAKIDNSIKVKGGKD